MASNSLSIILPAYNPLPDWQQKVLSCFKAIKEALPAISLELLIVNDGSTKNFNEQEIKDFFAGESSIKIISYTENRGKGYALRQGVKSATGELSIYTDIDFPYTHDSFIKLYKQLNTDSDDVIIGIRDENYYTHLPVSRTRISKFLRFFIKTSLRIPTDDTQCGLKGFNQKGKEVFLQTTIDRYLFDLEFVFMSARKKLNTKTLPVELRPEVELSKMPPKILLQESFNFFKVFYRSITG